MLREVLWWGNFCPWFIYFITKVLFFDTLRLNTELVRVWLYKQNHCNRWSSFSSKKKLFFFSTWLMVIETLITAKCLKIDRVALGNRTWWLSSGGWKHHNTASYSEVVGLRSACLVTALSCALWWCTKVLVAPVVWTLPPAAGAAAGKHSNET